MDMYLPGTNGPVEPDAGFDVDPDVSPILDSMPQLVSLHAMAGEILRFNQKWEELTGLPAHALKAGWRGRVHPADRDGLSAAFGNPAQGRQAVECRYRLRDRDGQWRWMLFRATRVAGADAAAGRWIGTSTDIHEQVTMQEKLHEANLRKDEFMALLAHELRNPMAPIATAAHMLKFDPGNRERVTQAAGIISRQVTHMRELVDDLLDLSRVARGVISLEMERVDLLAVVASAIEQSKPLIDAKDQQLVLDMPRDPARVEGDRSRLIQVVANLLNNAAKYTHEGGRIVGRIAVHAGRVRLAVEDNGIGIDPSLLPKIFKLFAQAAPTPERTQGGLGMGLALVRSIVAMHGGQVEARSEGRGKGSAFIVILPGGPGRPS